MTDRLLPNGRGQDDVTRFLLKICPNHIFGIGEAIGTSNFVC